MSRSQLAGLLTLALLVLPVLVASPARSSDLDEYYGFETMEILKLDWDLAPPWIGDLNGDGLNDLVVCNNRKSRIELLLQKPDFDPNAAAMAIEPDEDDINDLFGREKTWRFKRFHYPLHVKVASLVVADLNDDGQSDLAYYGDDSLRIVLQAEPETDSSPTPTDPSWLPETRVDLRDGLGLTGALQAGDIDNDNRTDLLLLLKDGYYILQQKETGVLARPVRHYSSSMNLKQAHIGDLDGDNRNDLLLLTGDRETYPLRVRFQDPDGGLGTESRYQIPLTSAVYLCRLGDSNRCCIASTSTQSGRLALYALVDGDQHKEVVAIHPLPSGDETDKRDMTCADVDGDDVMDMVVTDPGRGQFVLLRGRSGSGLGPVSVFPGLKDMRKICAARLADSSRDTLVVLSVDEKLIAVSRFENGRLSFPQTLPVVGEPQAMAVADLDANGHPDLAYISRGPDSNDDKFYLRTILDVGRRDVRPGRSVELTAVQERPLDLLACDIDHDGDTDLIVVRSYDPLLLVRQTTTRVFQEQGQDQTHSGLVSNLSPRAISVASLGPDGLPALLVARGDFARALYFDAEKGWQVIDQYQAGGPHRQFQVAGIVPRSDDGSVGIAAYDDVSGIVSFVEPQADGTYRVGRETDIGRAAVHKILTGRFGAGSKPEIILCGERKLISIQTGVTTDLRQVGGYESEDEGELFGHLDLGDINHDGVPEIVLCDRSRHRVEILAFDETAQLIDAYQFKTFETHAQEDPKTGRRLLGGEPRHVQVADVTGDGKNDLVLLVHDRIIIYPQD